MRTPSSGLRGLPSLTTLMATYRLAGGSQPGGASGQIASGLAGCA
jgi:hypothetical protein